MSCKKGQVAIEFFIFVGFAIVSTILFGFLALDQFKEYHDERDYELIKDLALTLQTEVYLATGSEEGYKREFTIPNLLDGNVNYTTEIRNNKTLYVYSDLNFYVTSVPEVVGNFTKQTNVIRKTGGVIYIN